VRGVELTLSAPASTAAARPLRTGCAPTVSGKKKCAGRRHRWFSQAPAALECRVMSRTTDFVRSLRRCSVGELAGRRRG